MGIMSVITVQCGRGKWSPKIKSDYTTVYDEKWTLVSEQPQRKMTIILTSALPPSLNLLFRLPAI